jgi:hypothetical protein
MGFRFRRRIKLLPGLWLNASKSGISTSVGHPGATINFKDGKTTTTVGLRGTGMSYRSVTPSSGSSVLGVVILFGLVLAAAAVAFMFP